MYSLKHHLWFAFMLMGAVLGLIVFLLLRQGQLNREFNKVAVHSSQLIFRFATVREQITAGLIAGSSDKLERIVPELERLHGEIKHLEEDPTIPPQLSLALIGKVDLAAVVISLRKVVNGDKNTDSVPQLQEQLRTVADQLLQYDRIVVGQARAAIVTLQKTIIGLMGLSISLASIGLVFFYRRALTPLLKMTQDLRDPDCNLSDTAPGTLGCQELADLAEAILNCRQAVREEGNDTDDAALALLAETVNETTNQLNGIMNYAQLLCDSADELALPAKEREMLEKIIEGGTRIAGAWGKITA